jgi:DHA2 family multidrug resistance protein
MATAPIVAAPRPEIEHTINPLTSAWRRFGTPVLVVLMALAIGLTLTRNWNAWEGGRVDQVTDDAFVRRDVTPLGTKVAGLVREVKVSDYQQVRKGDELVRLEDEDYRAGVAQATAAVDAARAALENNRRQRDLQDARIQRAVAGIDQAQGQIAAARAGTEAVQADVSRTNAERSRQEALFSTGSATRQRVESAVADAERFSAQLASREADLAQARALLRSNELAVEAERRSKAVLESQDLQLVADLHAKEAGLAVAQVNLNYTRIIAPADGAVGERQVRPGQLVSPGTQVVSFVDGTAWVQANFRETQLRNITVGSDARPGARDLACERIAVRTSATRQRHRQFHESCAARTGEDCARRLDAGDVVAVGIVGNRHRSNEVAGKTMKPDATRALASALPADLSHSPLLGILAVNMGAGIATLAARFLSLALADLRGHFGIGVDEGAWIGTAFNAATMFIGPLSVYLGALLGARSVLLVCCAVFASVSAALPLAHSYPMLILLMAIAGLSSGTFYPLTLSFALVNIPLRYLAITLGLYATCIEGALNFAPSLYGFYREHLSWEWMFWTSALATPVMAACVYYGIPASSRRRPSGPAPSFAGFLYASAGLALLFAALDQGQRLDWWGSGVFTALFTTGIFFLLCAALRRLSRPNPLVDLPFLRKWNTLALGFGIFAFRFCLLATALVIPQTLAVRGFDAAQIGPAVVWTAIPELCLAFFAAHLLNKGLDSRLLMASGFALMGSVCLLDANVTSMWAAENYFRTELLMAVGQSFAFVGLVSTIILHSFFSGALGSPSRVLTFSAFFHVVRIFAGQIGVTLMARFIAEQEKVHSYLIGLHVQSGGWIADHTVKLLTAGLAMRSAGAASAAGRALGVVAGGVRLQAYTLSFIDAFHLMAWMALVMLILVATLATFPLNYRDLAALDARAGQGRSGDRP